MFNMFHIVPLMDMCCSNGFSACLTLVVATTLVTIPMSKKCQKIDVGMFEAVTDWQSETSQGSPCKIMQFITNPCHGATLTPARWRIQLSQETF